MSLSRWQMLIATMTPKAVAGMCALAFWSAARTVAPLESLTGMVISLARCRRRVDLAFSRKSPLTGHLYSHLSQKIHKQMAQLVARLLIRESLRLRPHCGGNPL